MIYAMILVGSFVLAARYFEKKNMKIAASMHAVLFVTIVMGFLFTSESTIVQMGMSNIFGRETCEEIRELITEAIGVSYYGIGIMAAVWLVAVIQTVLAFVFAVRRVIRYLIKRAGRREDRRAPYGRLKYTNPIRRIERRNILYCRMNN